MTRGLPRESLNLRIQAATKRGVEEYARTKGVSINAAGQLLIDIALRSEQRKKP